MAMQEAPALNSARPARTDSNTSGRQVQRASLCGRATDPPDTVPRQEEHGDGAWCHAMPPPSTSPMTADSDPGANGEQPRALQSRASAGSESSGVARVGRVPVRCATSRQGRKRRGAGRSPVPVRVPDGGASAGSQRARAMRICRVIWSGGSRPQPGTDQ